MKPSLLQLLPGRLSGLFLASGLLLAAACSTGKAGPDDARRYDATEASDAEVPLIDAGDEDAAVGSGHSVQGTVSGQVKATSPNYILMGTSGKGENTSSSTNYIQRGGVVGASGE